MNEKVIYSAKVKEKYRHYTSGIGDLVKVGDYMDGAEVLDWFDKRQIQLFVRGFATRRHHRTEWALKRLVDTKKLIAFTDPTYRKQGNQKLVYALPRTAKKVHPEEIGMESPIEHGLFASECLLRMYLPYWKHEGVMIYPEKHFRALRLGSIPEWAIAYPMGTLVLGETSTRHDYQHTGKIKGKIRAYSDSLQRFYREFRTVPQIVFIIDIPRDVLRRFVERHTAEITENMNFTDYKTFLTAGNVIDEPIWIVNSGEEVSLSG